MKHKPFLKYVQTFHVGGKRFCYFRRKGAPRIPLPGLPGSAEFMAAYAVALAAAPKPIGADKRSKPGSVSAALAEYFQSRAFKGLTGGTPAQRRQVLERFRADHGHMPLASLPTSFLTALLDNLSPHAARTWVKALRHFCTWAVERKLLRVDPTLGIRIKLPKSDGFHTLSEDEITQFEAAHPIGTQARLAFGLGLFTALRNSDVGRLGRQNFRDGVLTVRPVKTQNTTNITLTIPVHSELQKILDATPNIGHLTLLVSKTGKPYSPRDLSEQFRRWCDAAGLPQRCTFHGLRKAALTRLADAGCTAHEIAAVSGHKTLKEVERYTKAADQVRLARSAMERIGNQSVKAEPAEVSKPLTTLPKKAG
jgi:integrase